MEKQLKLIAALRKTALDIQTNATYQWGHMGRCNCGFLAQNLTKLSAAEIHKNAMQRSGDWNEQLNEYCSNSGYPMDNLIFDLLLYGLSIQDLAQLERLSNLRILNKIDAARKPLSYNCAADVALYLYTWATIVEDDLLFKLDVESLVFENQSFSNSLKLCQ